MLIEVKFLPGYDILLEDYDELVPVFSALFMPQTGGVSDFMHGVAYRTILP
jgi:hypothetical protein